MYLPSPINGGFSKEMNTYEKEYELKNSGEFVRLHPCAQLGPKQVRNQQNQTFMAISYVKELFRA